jgi:ATP-dependent helicase/nuclease subunit B
VHKALELFARRYPGPLPSSATMALIAIADELYRSEGIPKSVTAIWRPRFAHAAEWFINIERERRAAIANTQVEIEGTLIINGPAGPFTLRGRADRIDVLKSGGAAILDYKPGRPAKTKQVENLLEPQLPLEGAILSVGGFGDTGPLVPHELIYVQFSGGAEAGKWEVPRVDAKQISAKAHKWLEERVAKYDDPRQAYVSRALAFRSDIAGDYDHLARVGEWIAEPSEEWDP